MVQQKIFIIILNWNGWKDTIACLRSLAEVREPTFGIAIVDNASTDDSAQQLQTFLAAWHAHPVALLANDRNLGFGGGMNRGIRYALNQEADWMLLLNNDTTVAPNFLSELLAEAKKDEKRGMLNPKILHADAPTRFWFMGGTLDWLRGRGAHRAFNEEDRGQYDTASFLESEYATGCCMLVSRRVIDAVGLMPEDYFLYYEDTEWSIKARKAGFVCGVAPAAKIWHKGAASTREGSSLYIRYHVRNGLLFVRRNGTRPQIAAAYLFSVLRFGRQAIKYLFMPPRRTWAKSIMRGIQDGWMKKTGDIKP